MLVAARLVALIGAAKRFHFRRRRGFVVFSLTTFASAAMSARCSLVTFGLRMISPCFWVGGTHKWGTGVWFRLAFY